MLELSDLRTVPLFDGLAAGSEERVLAELAALRADIAALREEKAQALGAARLPSPRTDAR